MTHKDDSLKHKKRIWHKNWRITHKEHIRKYKKEWHVKIRDLVFGYYSGNPPKCACCDEDNREFLCMDHINGDGSKQAKEIGYRVNIYRWLYKQNMPPGFRVLCHNCNMSLGIYGYCPHDREVNNG